MLEMVGASFEAQVNCSSECVVEFEAAGQWITACHSDPVLDTVSDYMLECSVCLYVCVCICICVWKLLLCDLCLHSWITCGVKNFSQHHNQPNTHCLVSTHAKFKWPWLLLKMDYRNMVFKMWFLNLCLLTTCDCEYKTVGHMLNYSVCGCVGVHACVYVYVCLCSSLCQWCGGVDWEGNSSQTYLPRPASSPAYFLMM